jgi:hypothetical protein
MSSGSLTRRSSDNTGVAQTASLMCLERPPGTTAGADIEAGANSPMVTDNSALRFLAQAPLLAGSVSFIDSTETKKTLNDAMLTLHRGLD